MVIGGEEVESAVGLGAGQLRDVLHQIEYQVPPGLELHRHLVDRFLRPLQRLEPGPLHERGDAGDGLGLELVQLVEDGHGGDGPTDAPSGHGVGLGQPADGDRSVEHALQRGDGCVLALEDEPLVDLIR